MSRNRPVPIVNNAPRAAIFERQSAGNANGGTLALESGETYYEFPITLTFETLVLRDSSGNFTNELISKDDDLYEKIEVTYDTAHDFRLVRHQRRNLIQKISDKFKNTFKSRSKGDTLPT